MRTADQWFEIYSESHKHPTNKLIHFVCVPMIVLSTLGLLQVIPHPFGAGPLHWGTIVAVLSLVFYVQLSWTLAVGMALGAGLALAVNAAIATVAPIGWVSLGIFAVAWVVQFVGHKIEGKKPSFFQDLQFLLVGPAWVMHFLFRKLHIPVGAGLARA